jgi:predicted acyltransferase
MSAHARVAEPPPAVAAPNADVTATPATPATQADAAKAHVAAATQRLMSIDALRGFDMFWIVGADYLVRGLKQLSSGPVVTALAEQLEHQAWEGIHFEDLIFPLFVFIAGVSIVFSLDKAIAQGGRVAAMKRLAVRALILYFLGVLIYGGFANPPENIRWVGVLQRIALSYFCASALYCVFKWRGLLATCLALLVGYWLAMKFVPVPGIGAGNYEEGKNLANYIDFHYLPGRKWDKTHDPEGLLSSFPAISTCLLGVLAGLYLKRDDLAGRAKAHGLMLAGLGCIALGYLWSLDMPVIKKIWTSSYVLVAGGYSALLLGVFYLVVDVWQIRRWALPFVWIGTNAIFIYLAHNLISFDKLAARFVGGSIYKSLGPFGDLTIAIVALLLTLAMVRYLYHRKIFIRI